MYKQQRLGSACIFMFPRSWIGDSSGMKQNFTNVNLVQLESLNTDGDKKKVWSSKKGNYCYYHCLGANHLFFRSTIRLLWGQELCFWVFDFLERFYHNVWQISSKMKTRLPRPPPPPPPQRPFTPRPSYKHSKLKSNGRSISKKDDTKDYICMKHSRDVL